MPSFIQLSSPVFNLLASPLFPAEVQVYSLLKHRFVPLDADDIMEYPNHKILYIDKN